MKMKMMLYLLLIVFGFSSISPAQEVIKADDSNKSLNKAKAQSVNDIIWFGVDFTMAKFTLVPEDPEVIVSKYLPAINKVIIMEPEKYNIREYFDKVNVTNSIDQAIENNAEIDPSTLVISNEYKLDPEKINDVLKKYTTPEGSGTGLIFIAENLNKATNFGSYYVTFFDIATKKIIDSRRMKGKTGGIGFRNFWASTVYNVMKLWPEQ
ncbi:MAG: hypothetical protein JXK95_13105 [Bacteroidales bacterium]|nr:hypothetical protein [Bacteroidales bacterium]